MLKTFCDNPVKFYRIALCLLSSKQKPQQIVSLRKRSLLKPPLCRRPALCRFRIACHRQEVRFLSFWSLQSPTGGMILGFWGFMSPTESMLSVVLRPPVTDWKHALRHFGSSCRRQEMPLLTFWRFQSPTGTVPAV